MSYPFAVLLACVLLVAGCAGVAPSSTSDESGRQATVTRVVDGDTVDVRYEDGGTDTVRLLGVDSPELGGGNEPGEFEGVPGTGAGRRCLVRAADEATAFAERHLAGANVSVVVDQAADRRDRYDRLLAYVVLANGTNLNYRLVEAGHARVYDTAFGQSERFYAAESRAQAEHRGLWRCREPGRTDVPGETSLRLASVHPDAAGDDHENLDDEYVTFGNDGDASLDLTGWSVRDEGGHVYAFPEGFSLEPGATVRIHTGTGTDSANSLYWGADEAIWNNAGDTVIVANASGTVVLRHQYRDQNQDQNRDQDWDGDRLRH